MAEEEKTNRVRQKAQQQRCYRTLANKIVTPDRLEWALESFKPYKSPGPDGIYPVLLKKAGSLMTGPLVRLIRASLILGHVPAAWQGTRIVFIPKAGRNGYLSPKDFRPISLTSFMLKTAERLVDRYIRDQTLANKPLYEDQHAYCTGKSTETALKRVVQLIEPQLSNEGYAVGNNGGHGFH